MQGYRSLGRPRLLRPSSRLRSSSPVSDVIENVKAKIQDQQWQVFAGKQLQDWLHTLGLQHPQATSSKRSLPCIWCCICVAALLSFLVSACQKYSCNKMICHKCYACLHPCAVNCSRKCGHTNNLNPKKVK